MIRQVDKRHTLIPLALAITLLGGGTVSLYVSKSNRNAIVAEPVPAGASAYPGDVDARRAHERFQQAVSLLQAGHFEYAVAALHEVLAIYPELPEAHVNMGYALLGLGDSSAAARFFDSASNLRPSLYNAYYGLALAERGKGNQVAALAAMQAFAHLAEQDDRHLPRAQEFIWELQEELQEASP